MYHYVNAVTNTKGDALIGYYVKAVDSVTGATASLYADANSTPIVSVSGVANAAKVDSDGNASFYIAGGQYHLDIYATDSTTFVRRISNVPMVDFTVAAGNVADRATLAAKNAANGDVWMLTEAGRTGLFKFDSSNLSTQVTNDPNQGVYIAPTAAPTGASGAFVRQFSGPLDVRWFGATGAGNPTNDAAAIQAAINFSYNNRNTANIGYGSGAGLSVFIPQAPGGGRWYCGGTKLTVSHTVRIFGTDSGEPSGSGSCLEWNGTCNGFEIATTGLGAIIEGLTLKGGFTTSEGEFHAVKRFAASIVRHCQMYDWPGDAVNDDENVGGGSTNGSDIYRIYTENCRCSHKAAGSNANAGSNFGIQSKNNRQAGVYQAGFLGDHYYSGSHNNAARTSWNTGATGHYASYAWSSGHVYACMVGQETWCSTNAPSGTTASNQGWIYWFDQAAADPASGIISWTTGLNWRAGGAYIHTGLNNKSTFVGCYAEDTNPSQFDLGASIINPFMSYAYLVSGGILYGAADYYGGGQMRAIFAAYTSTYPVRLGQSVIQATAAGQQADVWNSQSLGAGNSTGLRLQNGLEVDGVTRCNLAQIRASTTTTNPATAEAALYFATRHFSGTGAMDDRLVLDAPNTSWRPVNDNQFDSGLASFRWRTMYAYAGNFSTSVTIGGGTALTKAVVYTPSITPASVAAATVAEQTFTVTGLTTADKVIVNPPAISNATGIAGARVSAADTLAIRFVNPTAGALTPTSGTYTVIAFRS